MEKRIRRPRRGLTARRVETAVGPTKLYDDNGLILKVHASGSRQWLQRITIRGRQRELGLGGWPVVTLAMARDKALENRRLVALGRDPVAEARAAREEAQPLTFAECLDRYCDAKLREFKSEKHKKQWRSSVERLALPVLGRMRVDEIVTRDVLRALEPHWRERTVTAKKVRGRIENILTWAAVAGHREGDNPAAWRGNLKELLPAPSKVSKPVHHGALSLSDAPNWWTGVSKRTGTASEALRFAALTASRSGEVRGAIWPEVDLDERLWVIPASRMKSDREHRVPLSGAAVTLLQGLDRIDGVEFVFPAARGGQLSDMSLSACMRRLHEAETKAGREGYLDPQSGRPAVPHGLRSTFRQWAAERGYERDMAELALAHVVGSEVERAYQRSDMLERRRAMMEAWSEFLEGASEDGKVVAFDKAMR